MRRTDHDHVTCNQRRRVQANHAPDGVSRLVVIQLEIDDAFPAEGLNQTPGFRIERDHLIAGRHKDDPLIGAIGARPPGHAATCALTGRELTAPTFINLIHPEHLPGAWVQSHYGTGRACGGVEDPVHHQRRGGIQPVSSRPKIVRVQTPRDL